MELADLKDRHAGDTIWVLGSGASLNFLDPAFFADKPVVSTNYSARVFGVSKYYAFSHYHEVAHDLTREADAVVTLAGDTLTQRAWVGEPPDNLVLISQDSYNPPGSSWDPFTRNPPRVDSLAYGSSSFHGAMHLAAWLGAGFIVLVGGDCGHIDGEQNVTGYKDDHSPYPHTLYNEHHKLMKNWLVEKYGVGVYSLNPFINFNLEGHKFEGV